MNYEIYHIPTNFTDAGRVMGLFELRNLVETVILTVPVLYLCIAFLPFALTTKIIVSPEVFTLGLRLAQLKKVIQRPRVIRMPGSMPMMSITGDRISRELPLVTESAGIMP